MSVWADRSPEIRALLNPAFLGMIVHDLAVAYETENSDALPYALCFLGTAMLLHEPTRRQLPRNITTSMLSHLAAHPEARVALPEVAVQLVPYVREGLRMGIRYHGVTLDPRGALVGNALRRAPTGMNTEDLSACRGRAAFVGRWFARSGDTATILSLWGLTV